ncbi:MAG: S8 family serine peptidase [Terriglobales bacterium]
MALLLCVFTIQPCLAQGQNVTTEQSAQTPSKIFEDGKAEFFTAIDKFVSRHPRRSELSGDDMLRLHDARNQVPNLYERLMLIAYQKDAPQFDEWIRKGDAQSMTEFRKEFLDLAREYAARFVGSLFRVHPNPEFSLAMPHNKGKGRLDLVLQSLGYNAKNDAPPVPEDRRFTNKIEAEFYSQWAVAAINATKAQQISKGKDVIVAVIDSGLDPYNSLFKDRTVPGFSFVQNRTKAPWENEPVTTVDWGVHGTAVASAVVLIAPEARIMPLRALDGDTMNDPPYLYWAYETIAASIYWAVNHGAHVVQVSAALPSSEPVMWQAVRYAYAKNVVVSTSAGNVPRYQWGLRIQDGMYRSFDHEVLLVGGVAHRGTTFFPWNHTMPGPQMSVAVPSADVFAIVPTYIPEVKNDYVSGTSIASPLVSGVVALMRSAVPPTPSLLDKPGAYVRLISDSLKDTARLDVLGLAAPNDIVGQGLVDADAAVRAMQKKVAALNKTHTASR